MNPHPWSRILAKADGILQGGMKYSAYESHFKRKRKKQPTSQAQLKNKQVSFNTMIQTNKQSRKKWTQKIAESKLQEMEESLLDLENMESDKEEQIAPIKTQTQKKIVPFDTPKVEAVASSVSKENRIIAADKLPQNSQIQPAKQIIKYDRGDMMREVNDMISELQGMLQPRMAKIETEEKLQKSEQNNIKEWVRNLWKTEFLSDSVSLKSWKENFNESDILSIWDYTENKDPRIETLEESLFSQLNLEKNALADLTNKKQRNKKQLHSVSFLLEKQLEEE